jgi:hypothetical protein
MGILVTYLVVSTLAPQAQSGAFSRYDSIAPNRFLKTTFEYRRGTLGKVPDYATRFPLGAGIGTVGPAGGLRPGAQSGQLNAESQPTFLLIELGIPGLLVLTGFNLSLFALCLRRIRTLADPELRLLLASVGAPLFALFVSGVVGITTAATPGAPYFWGAAGVLAYWLTRRSGPAIHAPPA